MIKKKFLQSLKIAVRVLMKTVSMIPPLLKKTWQVTVSLSITGYKKARIYIPLYTDNFEGIYNRASLRKTTALLLISVNLVLFYKLLWAYFGMEDPMMIADSIIASIPGHGGLVFERMHNEFSRYFRNVVNYVFYQIWGISAVPHYAYAIILHTLIAWLIYVFTVKLTRDRRIGLMAAVLFTVLQINSEIMHWYAASSMYLPMTLFFLLGFLLFIEYQEKRRFSCLVLSLVCYMLALLSNQAAIVLIALLFLYDLLFCGNFRKGKISRLPVYLVKTYSSFVVFSYLFMKFIQKSATVVTPKGAKYIAEFITANIRILPHMFFPLPFVMKISDFLRSHGLQVLSASGYLYHIICFLLIALMITAVLFYKRSQQRVLGKLLILSFLGVYIAYAPFSFLSLSGYNTADALNYVMMRYYFLSSIFGVIFFSLVVYALYRLSNKYLKFSIILIVFTLVIYSFNLKNINVSRTAEWTAEGRQMIEEIKSYYPVFPEKSIICIRDGEIENHPAIGSRHVKELLFLYYADPENPRHRDELRDYEVNLRDSFNRERELYEYLTNIADIYTGTKPHIWGKRIFDHPYLNKNLPAYERVLLGLKKGFFDVEQVFVFDYKLGRKPVFVDVTQEVRKELREYVKIVRGTNIIAEEFDDTLNFIFEDISQPQVESGLMKLKTEQNFNERAKVYDLYNPALQTSDLNLTRMLPYSVEIRMKVTPFDSGKVRFPYVYREKLDADDILAEELRKELSRDKRKVLDTYRFLFDIQPFVSTYYRGHPYYKIWGLVDGKYGDKHAWIGAAESGYYPPNWVKIDLKEVLEVRGVVWSRDRTGSANNTINDYNIQVSLDDKNWIKVTEVKGLKDEKGLIKTDTFEPVKARFVKMEITDTEGDTISSPPCIDEFEVLVNSEKYEYKHHQEIIENYKDRFKFVGSEKQLEVLYEAEIPAKVSWVFSDDEEWDEAKSENFYIAPDGKFHVYHLFIPSSGKLYDKATLKQIKLCPAGIPSAIEIDYVRITPLEDDEFHLINRYGDTFVELYDLKTYKEKLFACGGYPLGIAKVFIYNDGDWQHVFGSQVEGGRMARKFLSFRDDLWVCQESGRDCSVIGFDGSEWQSKMTLQEKKALSLAEFDGKLYLGTGYQGKIIAFDGKNYKEVYCCETKKSYIFALISYEGKLYAATSEGKMVVFNGKRWEESTVSDKTGVYIRSFIIYADKLYAGTTDGRVLVVDGKKWRQVFDSGEKDITCFTVFEDKLYLGTRPSAKIISYDGREWKVVYNASQESITALGVYAGDLIAVSYPNGMVYTYDPENIICPWAVTSIIR